MKMTRFVVAFCMTCFLLEVTGAPNFTVCPTYPSCVSIPVTYRCRVDTSGGANVLNWNVLNATGGLLGNSLYTLASSVGSMTSIGTQFTTNLTSTDGSSIVSNITFTATMDINSYTVECIALEQSGITFTQVGAVENCSISVQGILSPPVPNDLMIYSDYLNFSWIPQSNSRCFSSYLVFVNSSVSNVTYETTDTSLSLPVTSTNDTEYSISVVAVDTGGRYMDPLEIQTFTPNVQLVMNLMLSQTSPEDDDDAVNITVSWNEPPYSSRPNVSDYIIYHNVPDPDTTITTTIAPTTAYNIPDATVGSVYTVGVAASNVLGTGVTASATISILSTVVVPTSSSIMETPTSSTETTDMSNFIEPSVSPSTSSTPTNGTTAGGSNSTVYIGIGAGIAVFAIVVIILIIVGCLIWCKPWKREKDSTEPIALVDKKDHGSSPATGQPIYQEAMSSEDIQREAAPTTGELYAQPNKGSVRRPPPQPQSELATYQDPSTIQRIQAPNMEYLYAEVDKSKPQQQQAVYAQVDKDKKGGDGTLYADLDLKTTQGGPVTGNNPPNVIYSDVHNN